VGVGATWFGSFEHEWAPAAVRWDDRATAKTHCEAEPDNWYRGIHEGGYAAAAIWALGVSTVTRIEAPRTHFDELNARERAIVAEAGVVAEEMFENSDIGGCQDDNRRFTEAIDEIRQAEGEQPLIRHR
jgi:hypothetical protein